MQKNKTLILVDVDGTLISPGMAPRQSLSQAIQEDSGEILDFEVEHFAGLTDPVIVENALTRLAYDPNRINGKVGKIIERYLELLVENYPKSNDKVLFPGAVSFLEFLKSSPFRVGIITGNVGRGARIKLSPFGLLEYFSFGVFGSDSADRNELPLIALKKVSEQFSEHFEPENVVIIGDTVYDVLCAHRNGMKSVVILRREEWRKKIESEKPELIVKSFEPLDILRYWFDSELSL